MEEVLGGAAEYALVDGKGHGALRGDPGADFGGGETGLEAVEAFGR